METKSGILYSGKLVWGLMLLAVSLLTELILAIYSLSTLGVEINSSTLAGQGANINPVQILISCLSPIGFVLKLVAIILIVQDSGRLKAATNGWQRRLAWIAVACFVFSLVAQLIAIFMSFGATTGGSLISLQLATWLSLAASVLGSAVAVLLAYLVVPGWARILLAASLLMYFIASIGTSVMTIQSTTLEKYELMGQTMYMPNVALDRTQGLYPLLSAAGTIAIGLALLSLLVPVISAWRSIKGDLPESVA